MDTLTLKKPVKINGELTEKLEYDLEALTGADVLHAVKELGKRGIVIGATEIDQNYHAELFAISAGISFEDMSLLNIKDYNIATIKVRDFFLDTSEA